MSETVEQTKGALEQVPCSDSPASPVSDASDLQASSFTSMLGCELPQDQVVAALGPCLTAAESRVSKTIQQTVESIESRVLGALNQAVTDIIDHLGKEAAARVVMAECKAALVEQEHIHTKQQALAMMLRLKHTSDNLIMETERKLLLERRRAQDAEAKLLTMQETAKRLRLELKRKGEMLEEMQRHAHAVGGALGRSGSASLNEGLDKRRKGISRIRQSEAKPCRVEESLGEEDLDDSAAVHCIPVASPSTTDLPSPPSAPTTICPSFTSLLSEEHAQVSPVSHKQAAQALSRINAHEGVSFMSLGCQEGPDALLDSFAELRRESDISGTCGGTVEFQHILEAYDPDESGAHGQESYGRGDIVPGGQDLNCIDDGAAALVTLRSSASISLSHHSPSCQTRKETVPRLKLEEEQHPGHGLMAGNGKEESRFTHGEPGGARLSMSSQSIRHTCKEATSQHVAGTSEPVSGDTLLGSVDDQTMQSRHSSAGSKRKRRQGLTPEKHSGSASKEKETKLSADSVCVGGFESCGSPGQKAGVHADAQDGSSILVVESSRDSRRLMQGARQLLSLRK